MSMFSWGTSPFDDAVEKATSEVRIAEEDIALNLEISDQIRSKAVPPKDAARALRRRLAHRNPNVQLLALALTDACVKNGGDHFLVEVAGKEFIDNMVSLLAAPDANLDVRARILRLVQNWAAAFEGKPALAYVAHVYKDLASRGFEFPPRDPALANAAMVDTSTAPEWIDADVCLRCRTPFSFTNRKHHCRNCGQVFDQQCSTHTMPLPHFGIAQDVRVCDSCYTRLTARRDRKERSQSVDFHAGHHPRPARYRHQDALDADIQRAIQLSLAESSASPYARPAWSSSEPPLIDRATRPAPAPAADEDDPELRAAIEASLREAQAPRPSAPYAEPEPDPVHDAPAPEPAYGAPPPPLPVLPNHDLHPREEDAILTFSQTVHDEPGTARRDLARVHALYDQASGLRPKLALSLDDAGRKEQMLGEMHEKLSHAVKLYDQLLTEQLARPAWQRGGLARAGTWHAGTPERQGAYAAAPFRAEAHHARTAEVYQAPPQAEPARAYAAQQPQAFQQPAQAFQQPAQAFQQPAQAFQQPAQAFQQQQQPAQSYQAQPAQQYQQQQAPTHPAQSYQQQQAPAQPAQSYQQQQVPAQPMQPYQQQVQPVSQPYQQQASQPVSQPYQQQPAQPLHQQSPVPGPSYQQQTWPAFEQQQQPAPAQQQPPTPAHEHAPYHAPVQSPAPVPAPQPQYAAQPRYTAPAQSPVASAPAPVPAPQPQYAAPQPQHTAPAQPPAPARHAAPPAAPPFFAAHAPLFPTAPTSNPQAFPLYGPGAPLAGLEHTETKQEAALIDL